LRLEKAEEEKHLVLATLLDPRFKTVYLTEHKIDQFKEWLICELEEMQKTENASNEVNCR